MNIDKKQKRLEGIFDFICYFVVDLSWYAVKHKNNKYHKCAHRMTTPSRKVPLVDIGAEFQIDHVLKTG